MQKFLFFIVCVLYAFNVQSQTFSIQAVNAGGGDINVQMQCNSAPCPTSSSSFVLDLVFGLKWQSSYDANLGIASGSYNMAKSAGELVSGVYEFQAFGATSTPYVFPDDWALNTWVTVMTIPASSSTTSMGTFEITETGFNATANPNININGSDFTPTVVSSATAVVLPLTLTAFNANANKNSINLNWETASESKLSNYELQRSTNSLDFGLVTKLEATNQESTSNYAYHDTEVQKGIRYFYRLKINELDGSFSYSPIRSVQLEGENNVVSVFPNPAHDRLHVDFESDIEEQVFIRLFDTAGRLVKEKNAEAQKGTNRFSVEALDLPSGSYSLQLISSSTQFSELIVIE